MLDRDLAEIYGYTTKALNQQVQRNKEKFEGEEFMFQLTYEELDELLRCHFGTLNEGSDSLRSQIVTARVSDGLQSKNLTVREAGGNSLRSQIVTLKNGRGKHTKYLPYAFTEQGIYMLMTVLKGELAVKQSRMLVMCGPELVLRG